MMVIAMRMVVFVAVSIIMVMMVMAVMMIMAVVMVVVVGNGIGAAFRFERRINRGHLGAKTLQQCFDRWIAFKPEPALQNLHRHMAISEMPSKAGKRWQIASTRFEQLLGLCHNLYKIAVVQHQHIVRSKPHRFGEIEFNAGPLGPEQEPFVCLPLRIRQDQSIDNGSGPPLSGSQNTGGAWHDVIRMFE
jgi:hypothetical protein